MAALGAGGAAGLPAAAAALAAPATPHNFTRVVVAGADATLDYWATPANSKLVFAFPGLGWVDSSTAVVGTRAAPALVISAITCPAATGTWGDAVSAPVEAMSDLTAGFTPAAASRFADAQASLGLFDRQYKHSQDYYDRLELLLSAKPSPLPTPSPFELVVGDVALLSSFTTGGSPAIAAVAAVPAVSAVVAQRAVAAVPAVHAVAAVAARPAVRAIPARNGRAAVPAQPAVRAVRAVAARAAVPATPAVRAVAAQAAVLAVAASPAVPPSGPPELAWWSLVTVGHSLDHDGVLPFLSFCRRGLLAPDRGSQVARADPTSAVRAISLTLVSFLQSVLPSGAAPAVAPSAGVADIILARHFRRFHERIYALPDPRCRC